MEIKMMDKAVREGFEQLVNRLSPENISCDGEISLTQILKRTAQIKREWKVLEAKAGRKVTQEEVELWEMADSRNQAIRGEGVSVI